MSWRVATAIERRDESSTARTLVFRVEGWPGHVAGQHVDVRLTAADGYSATRSYSVASAPDGDRIELTVQQVPDGEVSPYLTLDVAVGDRLEVRGPVGGWFVWRPAQHEPVQLVSGGSGVVPLMAMLRAHEKVESEARMELLYSVRDPDSVLYRNELEGSAASRVVIAYTRRAPAGSRRPPGRLDERLLAEATISPELAPTCYVCGPTGFVERVAGLLVKAGHDAARIRTERFGPSGVGHDHG